MKLHSKVAARRKARDGYLVTVHQIGVCIIRERGEGLASNLSQSLASVAAVKSHKLTLT